jgi:hypothetical protein
MGESVDGQGGGTRGWRSGVVILKNPTADAGRGAGATGRTGGDGGGVGDGYQSSGDSDLMWVMMVGRS